jgi:hypothetical protein
MLTKLGMCKQNLAEPPIPNFIKIHSAVLELLQAYRHKKEGWNKGV